MKILTENLPLGHPQEVLGSKQNGPLSISAPNPSDTYATLTSVVADSYDKQDLNIIFDSLLQKWPESGSFPDPNPEVCLVSLATLGKIFESGAVQPKKKSPCASSLSPTVIPSRKFIQVRSILVPMPAPQLRGSGTSSSFPWELHWLPLTRPMSCQWST